MKAIQILALPETDKFNPTLFALGEDGNIYGIPVGAAFAGEPWKPLSQLPEVDTKVDA